MPNISLLPLSDTTTEATLDRIARFFGHHAGLVGATDDLARKEALEVLRQWQSEDHALRIITVDGTDVGFAHVWFKGPIVAWIEDLWIDEDRRGHGIASATIGAIEDWLRTDYPEVEAVSMDVAPRNDNAMRLYHRLGYDSISMITLRKEITGKNPRTATTEFLGATFRY